MRNLTIGIFALAAVVLGFSFLLLTRGDDDGGLQANPTNTPSATSQTTTTPGTTTTTPGSGTPGASVTGTSTPGAGTPTQPGGVGGTYVVQPGDTCQAIADSNNVTLEAFLDANPDIDADCTNLQVDQQVTIP
jgi:LysM repeat protein